MKILFVMPKVGSWATHGKHVAPNQLYAHWAAYEGHANGVRPQK